jgi:tRNA(fMet)-specific endonuclease VapC
MKLWLLLTQVNEFLLDTNILIYLSKDAYSDLLTHIVHPTEDNLYISIVTLAELRSIAFQNNWGNKKWLAIEKYVSRSVLIEINENLLDTYVQIDAYSQRQNSTYKKYEFNSPRNMGKNDLWIAATAALLNLTLITTDKDFEHLHAVFLELKFLSP